MSRSSLGLPITVAVAGLAVLGLGQGIVNRQSIEDQLTVASTKALGDAGLQGSVDFTGRDATVFGYPGTAEQARQVVLGVDGVRVATLQVADGAPVKPSAPATPSAPSSTPTPPASASATTSAEPTPPAPADAPLAPTLPIGLTFDGGGLVLSGRVPSEAARDDVLGAARDASFDWKVTDRMTVDPAVPNVADSWFPALTRLIGTVASDGPTFVARYESDSVILRGVPATRAAEQRILAAAAGTVSDSGSVLDGLDPPAPRKR